MWNRHLFTAVIIIFGFVFCISQFSNFWWIGKSVLSITTPAQIQTKFEQNHIGIDEYMKHSLLQDDPRILNYITTMGYLIPPSTQPYNLTSPTIDPSQGQSKVVKEILKYMKNGFFVECGALDGEIRSNTLNLELNFGWKGLLIEGDPKNYKLLKEKGRKVWSSNACLATSPFPHQVIYKQKFNLGKILGPADNFELLTNQKEGNVIVQCFPLYSLLTTIGVSTVDYFSLDVEGNEYEVLQTIPFDKILIRILSVEYIHDKVSKDEISNFMETKGYRVITTVTNSRNLANDLIFAHKSVIFTGTIAPIIT